MNSIKANRSRQENVHWCIYIYIYIYINMVHACRFPAPRLERARDVLVEVELVRRAVSERNMTSPSAMGKTSCLFPTGAQSTL